MADRKYATIDNDTKIEAFDNEYVREASKRLLDMAENIMGTLNNNDLTPKGVKKDGSEYPSTAVVEVKEATKWNKETQTAEPIVKADGSPVYLNTITIPSQNEHIVLYAKNDMEKGIELSNMKTKAWQQNENGKNYFGFTDNVSGKTADIMKCLVDNGYVAEQSKEPKKEYSNEYSKLQRLAFELNKQFSELDDKVLNKDGKEVNNAYASYKKDEYGEKVVLGNHEDKVIVELGETKDGNPYAKAINFEVRDDNGKVASLILHNIEEVDTYVTNDAIREAVKEYKGVDLYTTIEYTEMQNFAYELNQRAKDSGDMVVVPVKDGNGNITNEDKIVANVYAVYKNDEQYGEQISIFNHEDKSIVSLSAKSTVDADGNMTYTEKTAKYISENVNEQGRREFVYINNMSDVNKLISNDLIKEAVKDFKGMEEPQKSKGKSAPTME